jgi:2-hydroxy-6-oxonona-2,4-dienedioate hydrolase
VDTACGPVEVAESGSGPPVLVVHGTGGGFDQGMMAAKGAFGIGYLVIAPSRFGYLRSPMPADASHAAQADTLAALLDALEMPRAVVVAVSAGAQPATQLALRHPARVRHSCSSPPPSMSHHRLEFHPRRGHPALSSTTCWPRTSSSGRSPTWHRTCWCGSPACHPPSSVRSPRELREQLVDGFFPASARHVGLAHDIRTTTPIAPDLLIEQLRMPVLLVGTADDPYKTGEVVRYAAGRLPTATALILETSGHVLIGQDDRIRQAVQAFLGAHATHAEQSLG